MDYNAGGYLAGLITWLALLAAIMSTCDSVLCAVVQVMTCEFGPACFALVKAEPKPHRLLLFSRFCSIFSMTISLLIAFYWKSSLSYMARTQFAISCQAVPPFAYGLFGGSATPHPWVLTAGAIAGVIALCLFEFSFNPHADFPIHAGLAGMVINAAFCAIVHAVWRRSPLQRRPPPTFVPTRSKAFGKKPLSYELIRETMAQTAEPVHQAWLLPSWLLLSIVAYPFYGSSTESGGPQIVNGTLATPPVTVGGMPAWIFKFLIASIGLACLQIYGFTTWKTPADAPPADAAAPRTVQQVEIVSSEA